MDEPNEYLIDWSNCGMRGQTSSATWRRCMTVVVRLESPRTFKLKPEELLVNESVSF